MNWDIIITVISGLTVCIPLLIKLVQTIYTHAQEKNWAAIVGVVLNYMTEAEKLYSNGEQRKEYVMLMVEKSAKLVSYNYNEEAKAKVSAMIDSICDASKIINAK